MDTAAFDFYNFKIDNLVVRKNVRISGHNDDAAKAFCHVTLRKPEMLQALVRSLNSENNVRSVNVFFDEDDVVTQAV